MGIGGIVIRGPELTAVKRLLTACDLPHADLTPTHLEEFYASGSATSPTGVVGLEIRGTAALLRSLAVHPDHRGQGMGRRLVAFAERRALGRGVVMIYLLTETAERFFADLGYRVLPRSQAPAAIQRTTEFASLCPSTAVFMGKRIDSWYGERRTTDAAPQEKRTDPTDEPAGSEIAF